HRGNAEVVRFLLKKGAKVISDKSLEVRNDASALFFAAAAGDVQTIGALLDAGGKVDQRMMLLGQFSITPLNYTISLGDPELIDYLISKGADPNEMDNDQISMLGWATIANQASVVKALLARGAKVNHVDKFGMTPLLYAASIDFGDRTVTEKLIAAGADLKPKNKQGLTALDLAKHYNYATLANLLASNTH